jgi:L-malate glycosyltransferase
MKICVAAPIATADLQAYLDPLQAGAPQGYPGAPLTAVLIGELLRMGHQVHAVTVDYSGAMHKKDGVARFTGPGLALTVVPGRKRVWRFNGWALGRAVDVFQQERALLKAAIANSDADVVHAHWTYEFALAALDTQLPCVVTAHDSPRQVFRHTRTAYRALRWLMAQRVYRRARRLTAVSPYMLSELGAQGHSQVELVPNPVAPAVFASGRAREQAAACAVGMVCNGWGDRKNPAVALEGFAQWHALHPKAVLHLFGADFGPGELAQRWALARGMGDGLRFHGMLPHNELIRRLAELDALLHPALEESFGVVLAEAMALGLPVVAGRGSGAVPWVVGADAAGRTPCAVLVDVRSARAIFAGLQEVFDASYGARSMAGLTIARQRFGASTVALAYERLYKEAIHHAHAAPTSVALARLK